MLGSTPPAKATSKPICPPGQIIVLAIVVLSIVIDKNRQTCAIDLELIDWRRRIQMYE
jgi:hypothetical protein